MTTSLRIAHLTPTWFPEKSVVGRGESHVRNVIRAIHTAADAEGLELQSQVITIGSSPHGSNDHLCGIVTREPEAMSGPSMDSFSGQLWDALEGTDLIHVHQGLTLFGAYATALAASRGIPLVLTNLGWGNDVLMTSGRGFELASAVISTSEYSRRRLVGSYGGIHEVIVGPVDTEFFCPSDPTPGVDPYVISLGRILPYKRFERIICALPTNLHLKIVGRAYDPEYLQELLRLSQGKDVEITTNASDAAVRSLLVDALGYVDASTTHDSVGNHVSNLQPKGLAPLEALACGTPILLSDVASLPGPAEATPYARIFRADAELADLLMNLAEHGWPVPVDKQDAWEFVRSRYGLSAVGSQLLAVYRRAIEGFVR